MIVVMCGSIAMVGMVICRCFAMVGVAMCWSVANEILGRQSQHFKGRASYPGIPPPPQEI